MSVCAVVKPSVAFCPGAQEMAPEFEAERWQQVHRDKCCCAWVLSGDRRVLSFHAWAASWTL